MPSGYDPRLYPQGANGSYGLADASITVGAESTNVREILVQLKDAGGAPLTAKQAVEIIVLKDANGDAFVSVGGSTGIALGTGGQGAVVAVVAKKIFRALCEANGQIDLKYTDSGTESAYLAVRLPDGRLVISAAMTNT